MALLGRVKIKTRFYNSQNVSNSATFSMMDTVKRSKILGPWRGVERIERKRLGLGRPQ